MPFASKSTRFRRLVEVIELRACRGLCCAEVFDVTGGRSIARETALKENTAPAASPWASLRRNEGEGLVDDALCCGCRVV